MRWSPVRVIRANAEANFTKIVNQAVRDQRLSWRARGLLAELLSYPDGWDINVDKMVAAAKKAGGRVEGREALRSAMRELEGLGYVVHEKSQVKGGKWVTESYVTDLPELISNRRPENRTSVDRASVSRTSVHRTSDTRALSSKTVKKTVTKNDQKTVAESLSATGGMDAPPGAPPERERDETDSISKTKPDYRTRYLAERGITDPDETAAVLAWFEKEYPRRGPGWWRTTAGNGDLDALVDTARRSVTVNRPWCGKCELPNRQIHPPGDRRRRCPDCHPEAQRRTRDQSKVLPNMRVSTSFDGFQAMIDRKRRANAPGGEDPQTG